MEEFTHIEEILYGNENSFPLSGVYEGFLVNLRVGFDFNDKQSKEILLIFEIELKKYYNEEFVPKKLMSYIFDTIMTLYSMHGVIKLDKKIDEKIIHMIVEIDKLISEYIELQPKST